MENKDRPIGFYDSGVGGVGVLRETVKQLPHENFIYFGDSANAPYGTKDEDTIKDLSMICGDFLYQKGVKMIVIACNTATSIVVKTMREKYNIPIVSMEPAVKPAAEKYAEGDILVMATPATLRQKRYHTLIERLGIQDRVIDIGCGNLAELVEAGAADDPNIRAYLCEKLSPFRNNKNICSIVIGCTHYSFVSEDIACVAHKLLKGNCEIFDGMYGTARHIARLTDELQLKSTRKGQGSIEFYSSAGEKTLGLYRRFFTL